MPHLQHPGYSVKIYDVNTDGKINSFLSGDFNKYPARSAGSAGSVVEHGVRVWFKHTTTGNASGT